MNPSKANNETHGEMSMNALEIKFNNMNANDTFEVIAGIMKSEPTAESDIVLDFAMDALMTKVGDAEFTRLMEQF